MSSQDDPDSDPGTEQWSFKTGDWVRSSPTVVDGTVYVGSNDDNLYAVDAATGTEQWSFNTGDRVRSSPTVVDGTVYVGSDDNNLYAITTSSRLENRGIQPSKSAPEMNRSSIPEEPPQVHLEGIEAGTEHIPSLQAVRSPRRRTLSSEDFQTIENLGHGGQAVIKKVRLPDSKTPPEAVALREPAASETMTQEAVEEFFEGAETWRIIDAHEREKQRWERSEHIVGLIDTGDRLPWIAMEYMNGGDLRVLLGEHPDGLPVGQALWVGECVCRGLEIAHQLGRVHLDVKPGNVLLKQTDGWPWPKLADWGLARTLAKETGTMEGLSVEYASPEQFDSGKFGDPDQLTDIYQTGALVYALLTGEPPVTGSPFEVMQQVMSERSFAVPSERRPELPGVVDAAVGLALEQDKTERYDSITEFRKALQAIRTDERLPRAVTTRLGE
ncbi:protein kinase domain-containing protein [Halorientalis salina]|uniref:protein kinase domain-containing protein n=1 Tax=Halorientalis salina TaxID=2932266 RepID=UPI0010AD89F4|nr:PQQ-binding-like beta-propeller repeat protein [Halorientalis salina]